MWLNKKVKSEASLLLKLGILTLSTRLPFVVFRDRELKGCFLGLSLNNNMF